MEHIKNLKLLTVSLLTVFLATTISAQAADGDTPEVYSKMPIKEVTIFKDGHAFVLHEGQVPTDENGNVVFDYLPTPVMGTFWAYSADPKVKLSCVVAGRKIVTLENTALNVPELLKANIGKKILFRDNYNSSIQYEATIIGLPERSTEELAETASPSEEEKLPVAGTVVLLKITGGIKVVPIDSIREITFLDNPDEKIKYSDFKNTMTLKLDWQAAKSKPVADVGMVYVQKGIRWIPSYKIEIDGSGNAKLKLQAAIINELIDLDNVRVHLVIGVPEFAFSDIPDPISLGRTAARLSQYFQESAQTGYAFSNAIMSQVADGRSYRENERQPASAETIDLGPEVAGSGKNEDLFVFTVENVSLKKGQRMVIPVTEFELSYSDIYKLTLNFTPPQQIHQNFSSQQLKQLAKYLATPKPKHVLRLKNDSAYPLTTAPALILKNGKLISQGMITYTPAGADCDLEMSSAIDIRAKTQNEQKNFTPNAININSDSYSRADMTGLISITNHKTEKVKIEVTRFVLGSIDEATGDADIQQLGHFFDVWAMDEDLPEWVNWYSWPWWWYHVNTLGQISWSIELEPDEKVQLEYSWHYFWR